MIRLTCSGCGSKLNAKDELAGQTRKCPKCGTAMVIPAPHDDLSQVEVAPDQHVHGIAEEPLAVFDGPQRLDRLNRYLICDHAKVMATWENNGHGWMLRTAAGFVSAARNYEQLPGQGDFRLVELKMAMVDDIPKLKGISVYQLAKHYALLTLRRGDDQVLDTVTGLGPLLRDQKAAVRAHLREHYMRSIWENAAAVMEYLNNDDYVSSGVLEPAAASE